MPRACQESFFCFTKQKTGKLRRSCSTKGKAGFLLVNLVQCDNKDHLGRFAKLGRLEANMGLLGSAQHSKRYCQVWLERNDGTDLPEVCVCVCVCVSVCIGVESTAPKV